MLNKKINKLGFTIVELLVVIVVIGILAAITIVSYSGISKKAIVASLQSDLDNNSKILKLYNAEYGVYPSTLDGNNCALTLYADTRYCIKTSGDTSISYTGSGQSFTLTATKNSVSYRVTENQSPALVATAPVTSIAAITGTPQIAQTLSAGAITPASATVAYQWQIAATAGGTYSDISGANASTYIVNPSNVNKYFKVIATGMGDYYGSQTSAATGSAAVVDSNWMTIGTQIWAKANANVGTMITGSTDQTNNSVLEKYCQNNTESNCTTYGGLYQWDEAMQYVTTDDAQGICPAGSHIPSDNDWKILEIQLGMTQAQADALDSRGTNQGTQLKTGGASGLNIPFGGVRNDVGVFANFPSSDAHLWTSTQYSGANAWRRYLHSSLATVLRSSDPKAYGFSVRCLAN